MAVAKSYQNNRPLTTCSRHARRPQGLRDYIQLLEHIVRQTHPERKSLNKMKRPWSHALCYKVKLTDDRSDAMRIMRAEHLGMCFGVRDAIALAVRKAKAGPLTILGDLVHNETVLAGLRRRRIVIEQNAGEVTTPAVMVTAHGASRALGRALSSDAC